MTSTTKTYAVNVYEERSCVVRVTVSAEASSDEIIEAAQKASESLPQSAWEYVPDSVNTDPDCDIEEVLP
jgi:hypothetical protein